MTDFLKFYHLLGPGFRWLEARWSSLVIERAPPGKQSELAYKLIVFFQRRKDAPLTNSLIFLQIIYSA